MCICCSRFAFVLCVCLLACACLSLRAEGPKPGPLLPCQHLAGGCSGLCLQHASRTKLWKPIQTYAGLARSMRTMGDGIICVCICICISTCSTLYPLRCYHPSSWYPERLWVVWLRIGLRLPELPELALKFLWSQPGALRKKRYLLGTVVQYGCRHGKVQVTGRLRASEKAQDSLPRRFGQQRPKNKNVFARIANFLVALGARSAPVQLLRTTSQHSCWSPKPGPLSNLGSAEMRCERRENEHLQTGP